MKTTILENNIIQFVFVGVALAVVMELCGVNSLSFAVAYLPLSTTLPIFCGRAICGLVDWRKKRKGEIVAEDDLGKGNSFATGLVAGGAMGWCYICFINSRQRKHSCKLQTINLESLLEDSLVLMYINCWRDCICVDGFVVIYNRNEKA